MYEALPAAAGATVEIFAFGERIALKTLTPSLRTSSGFALPGNPDSVVWIVTLACLGLAGWAGARGALVLVARRPALAGTAIAIAVVIAIPPVSWSGGGGGPVFYWELADPLGTGMVLLDEDGARLRHKTFKPFGGDYASVGTLQSWNVSYAGHRRHDDTGLYYMQARWMDPNAGTFLSIDPLVPNAYDPQTVNPFAYARNNPINWIDPDGQAACGPLGIACFGLNPSEIANWLGSGFSDLAAINIDFYQKAIAYENRKSLIVAKQSAAAEANRDAALEAEIANRTGQEPAKPPNEVRLVEEARGQTLDLVLEEGGQVILSVPRETEITIQVRNEGLIPSRAEAAVGAGELVQTDQGLVARDTEPAAPVERLGFAPAGLPGGDPKTIRVMVPPAKSSLIRKGSPVVVIRSLKGRIGVTVTGPGVEVFSPPGVGT